MRLLHRLEFACGLATLLFGAVQVAVAFGTDAYAAKPSANLGDFLWVALTSALMPALVAVGSYIHGIKQKQWGVYLLGICGLVALLIIFILFFSFMASWYYPAWLAFVSFAPVMMAVLTMFIAVLVSGEKNISIRGHDDGAV